MTRVREACRRAGTLFVMDEVATGFGRTGRLFATEHFELEPDVMCLAKAITAGYAPMGATVAAPKSPAAGVSFYSTYGWHPLSVAAASANLKYWSKHQRAILDNVAAQSDYFRARLMELEFKEPGSVRILGLAIGIEFAEGSDYPSKLADRCRRAGLLVDGDDNLLNLFPPLTIEREDAAQGLDILEECC